LDEKQFETLTAKIDLLVKLLAFSVVSGKSVNDQVDLLTRIGLKANEIAYVLGKTENQVYVTQNILKKAKKKTSVRVTEKPSQQQIDGNQNVQ
jgi:ABC-type uncharacterized transport system substrate-binding protein